MSQSKSHTYHSRKEIQYAIFSIQLKTASKLRMVSYQSASLEEKQKYIFHKKVNTLKKSMENNKNFYNEIART